MRSRTWPPAASAVALVLLAGCGASRDDTANATANEGQPPAAATASADAATPAAADGTPAPAQADSAASAGDTDETSAAMVDQRSAAEALGVPLYPGARVASAIVGSGDGGRGAMVTLETTALPADVMGFYRERVAQAGYAVKAEVNTGSMRMLGAEKDNRSLTVQVAPKEGGGSTVALLAGSR
jgi:hypothetical protein